MAIIAQKKLFGWREIEELGNLDRLRLVLQWLPDEPLIWKRSAVGGGMNTRCGGSGTR